MNLRIEQKKVIRRQYKVGDVFQTGGELVVLAQTGAGKISGLGLRSWNRQNEALQVEGGCFDISASEVRTILGVKSTDVGALLIARQIKIGEDKTNWDERGDE